MSGLLTAAETGDYLRVRDRRTVRRRLAELGVPVVPAGRSFLVREVDLQRAVATAARLERAEPQGSEVRPGGLTLPAGVRLGTPEARAHLAGRSAVAVSSRPRQHQ